MYRRFVTRVRLKETPEAVFEWHQGRGVVERLTPPWIAYDHLVRRGGLEVGATTSMTLKWGPFSVDWHSVHTRCVEGSLFTDTMEKGPFHSFEHTHCFEAAEGGGCLLTDSLSYRLPVDRLSHPVMGSVVERDLERMFRYRHLITARDIASRMADGSASLKTVVVSGASGVIGSVLVPWLRSQGHRVLTLVRRKTVGDMEIFWDPARGILDPMSLEGCDVIIHLAGENIGDGRWTPEKRARIIRSRVDGTALLARTASRLEQAPPLFLCASAVGYYGNRHGVAVTESDPSGEAFISEVCRQWEAAAEAHWTRPGGRLVILRIGVVLTPSGGAMKRLLPLFKMGLGGGFGRGDQYMSWVSMEDVLGAMAHIMGTPDLSGPVNLTAPHPLTNRRVTEALARGVHRSVFINLPSGLVTAMFGDMGREVLLDGVKALPHALLQSGYQFIHPTLDALLDEVL